MPLNRDTENNSCEKELNVSETQENNKKWELQISHLGLQSNKHVQSYINTLM